MDKVLKKKNKDSNIKEMAIQHAANFTLSLIGVAVVVYVADVLWDAYYQTDLEVWIKNLLLGLTSGEPAAAVPYMFSVFTDILKASYESNRAIPWFGVYLTMINTATIFVVIRRLLSFITKFYLKVLAVVGSILVLGSVFLYHGIFLQINIEAGIAIGAAAFSYLSSKESLSKSEFVTDNILTLLLLLSGIGLSRKVFFIFLPGLVCIFALKYISGAKTLKHKLKNKYSLLQCSYSFECLIKYALLPVLFIVFTVIIEGIDRAKTGTIDMSVYELSRYNNEFAPLAAESFGTALAHVFTDLFTFRFKELTLLLMLLFVTFILVGVASRKWGVLYEAIMLLTAHVIAGVLLFTSGECTEYICRGLILSEIFTMAGFTVMRFISILGIKKSNKKRKILVWSIKGVILLFCLGSITPLIGNMKEVKAEQVLREETDSKMRKLKIALDEYNDEVFILEDGINLNISEKVYRDSFIRPENYIYRNQTQILTKDPESLYAVKCRRLGIEDEDKALLEDKVYYVTGIGTDNEWIKDHFLDDLDTEVYVNKLELEETDYECLSYTIRDFEREFAAKLHTHSFLAEKSGESFSMNIIQKFLAMIYYSENETIDMKMMNRRVKQMHNANPLMSDMLLLLDPFNNDYVNDTERIAYLEEIITIFSNHDRSKYAVILYTPSGDTWLENEADIDAKIDSYKSLIQKFKDCDNIELYFTGANSWIIYNSGVDKDDCIDPAVAEYEIAEWINAENVINEENMDEVFKSLKNNIEEYKKEKAAIGDLSGSTICFFGDSIYGNTTDVTSIPSLVGNLTNASFVDRSVCGTTASADFENAVTEYFESADYKGMGNIYCINFGINDFIGNVVAEGDAEGTYEHGLNAGIDAILAGDPQAKIYLMTPYNILYTKDDIERYESEVETVKRVASDRNVNVLDMYNEFEINDENMGTYLCGDGVHPNHEGRVKYACLLSEKLTKDGGQ